MSGHDSEPFRFEIGAVGQTCAARRIGPFSDRLVISSFIFNLLAIGTGIRSLPKAAYYDLIGAAITAVAAVVTGVLAWQLQLEGERLRGNLRLHLGFGERRTDPSSLNRKLARKMPITIFHHSRQSRGGNGHLRKLPKAVVVRNSEGTPITMLSMVRAMASLESFGDGLSSFWALRPEDAC